MHIQRNTVLYNKELIKLYRKHPFRQDIFKQTYQNVVFRDYILTLALYIYCTYASLNTGGIKFIKMIIVWSISNLLSLKWPWFSCTFRFEYNIQLWFFHLSKTALQIHVTSLSCSAKFVKDNYNNILGNNLFRSTVGIG